ncbi:hypothetical protein Hypma_000771 [Hypsizygus marmoreus]|uniref:Uncharacterized protein n=1 Tax=Hypsizygus marmoreus TaxID=39966 RepID=A0A369JB60_HYPMA|nr:hypothetical protein Hypma_000771 [Hypsizygus marmoreus]
MDRLCDEVVQLIFYELIDPGPLTLVSKRFYRFSQDPYVRAHYFLTHYGPAEAMFYALGRGKVLTERVLDILLMSGAHLSRYLIQVAMHHYFYTQSHFIKTPWVRNVPLRVFTYFMKLAEEMYGEIPRGKGEDDGSVFSNFLKESRLLPGMKSISWESIRDILKEYNFMPFSTRDPIMAQFPLALAIEPRLLPYAVENGFQMDSKYRDFVFRKMFERPTSTSETVAEDIAHNIQELCRLDSTMFVSRTVAAEVCMEAKLNPTGYAALKQLDKSGHLRFELSGLVEDLIKTFIRTRSISTSHIIENLRLLYTDFPSSDPTARLVILITIFIASENLHSSPSAIQTKLEALSLTPVTRKDVFDVLASPFVDRYNTLLDYAKREIVERDDGTKGMGSNEIEEVVEEVASKCLEVACKGKLLKKLCDGYISVRNVIATTILKKYQLALEDLPTRGNEDACRVFEAKLCRDFMKFGLFEPKGKESEVPRPSAAEDEGDGLVEVNNEVVAMERDDDASMSLFNSRWFSNLGHEQGRITQESLTTMIRRDEISPVRPRRRMQYPGGLYFDSSAKLPYPNDPLAVGRWIKTEFGPRSSVTAVFMTHAVVNDNHSILHQYLYYADGVQPISTTNHVPITFKHFQILAHLDRAPNYYLYHDIELGAEFYRDTNDYLKADTGKQSSGGKAVKMETTPPILLSTARESLDSPPSVPRGRKRPRRVASNVRSYVVPDSDDEAIANSDDLTTKPKNVETTLQTWLRHLDELMKQELRKLKEKRKQIELVSEPGTKVRVAKGEFLKSLSSNLRALHKIAKERQLKLYGPTVVPEEYSDNEDDDDEYRHRTARNKRKKTNRSS